MASGPGGSPSRYSVSWVAWFSSSLGVISCKTMSQLASSSSPGASLSLSAVSGGATGMTRLPRPSCISVSCRRHCALDISSVWGSPALASWAAPCLRVGNWAASERSGAVEVAENGESTDPVVQWPRGGTLTGPSQRKHSGHGADRSQISAVPPADAWDSRRHWVARIVLARPLYGRQYTAEPSAFLP